MNVEISHRLTYLFIERAFRVEHTNDFTCLVAYDDICLESHLCHT